MFRSLRVCVTLACVVLSGAAMAQTAPQNRKEWVQAAWSSMAHLNNLPPETADLTGKYEVQVSVTVRRDGTVTASNLLKSSGQEALDSNAVRLVMRVSPLPPLPPDMRDREHVTLAVAYDLGSPPPQLTRAQRRRLFSRQP